MPLPESDHHRLTVAQGYLELGLFLDAADELEKIAPSFRHLPEVLEISLGIYTGLGKWELMQAVAKTLAEANPANPQWWISWAYATRRAESIEAAKPILLAAVENHPDEAMIRYNLACYEAQLGDLQSAREYLKRACMLGEYCRAMALEDEDLKPLWKSLPRK